MVPDPPKVAQTTVRKGQLGRKDFGRKGLDLEAKRPAERANLGREGLAGSTDERAIVYR